MSKNSMIALVAGILFGVLAFMLLYEQTSEIEKKTTPVQILIASQYIPAGAFLRPDMVEKKSIPGSYVSPSAIKDPKEVEGLMTLVPISSGEQVLSNKFGMGDESLALTLNPGYRAYTLEVNEPSGVGNLLKPGNHVDILTKMDSDKRSIVSMVFQNIQIIAVGQSLNWKPSSGKGSSISSADSPGYNTVTLAITPEQAETLMDLDGHPLRLILRGPGDEEIVTVPYQTESEVLSKLGHITTQDKQGIQIIRAGTK
jgi:pilus assembly protein CpaB